MPTKTSCKINWHAIRMAVYAHQMRDSFITNSVKLLGMPNASPTSHSTLHVPYVTKCADRQMDRSIILNHVTQMKSYQQEGFRAILVECCAGHWLDWKVTMKYIRTHFSLYLRNSLDIHHVCVCGGGVHTHKSIEKEILKMWKNHKHQIFFKSLLDEAENFSAIPSVHT